MTTGFSSSESTEKMPEQDVELASNVVEGADSNDLQESEATETPVSEDWESKYHELNDQHLRLAADFENFRKRMASDREGLLKYGSQSTIDQLLPVLDNLQRAADSLSESSEPKMLYQSFNMLSVQLLDTLSAVGLKKIDTKGQAFDPKFHDAVQQLPSPDVPENHVIHEQQSGYMLHDRVLRPAQVIVAMAPVSPASDSSESSGQNPFASTGDASSVAE